MGNGELLPAVFVFYDCYVILGSGKKLMIVNKPFL
jgi:hypothetical protein